MKKCPGCKTEMKRVVLFDKETPLLSISRDGFKTCKNYDLYECPECGLTLYWRRKQ